MSWRVKPDEVLIEVGKVFGSKIGLQKLNYEVSIVPGTKKNFVWRECESLKVVPELLISSVWRQLGSRLYYQLWKCSCYSNCHHHRRVQGRKSCHQENIKEKGFDSHSTLTQVGSHGFRLFLSRLNSIQRFCGKLKTPETSIVRIQFGLLGPVSTYLAHTCSSSPSIARKLWRTFSITKRFS